jgi:hypothetical protein
MCRMADCAAIVNELDEVDWFSLLEKRMDCCVDLFYEMVSSGGRKFPLIISELSCLKNKKTKASKRSKASEKRCLEDETIDDCEYEKLRGEFLSIRENS